ncbi:hypothetical protein [Komagataeibacter phage phiKX1]|nr:hypothetical protein [Komagataeibacter phage phiKX1]BCZ76140.1 hypothetical protein [Komagataeibacter phage phiKX2]
MRKFLVAFGLMCLPVAAQAQQDSPPTLPYPSPLFGNGTNFSVWGFSATVSNANGVCSVNAKIDQPTFAGQVQDMIDKGIFSKKVSPTMGNSAPHYLMDVFEIEVAPVIVKSLFDESGSPDKCHFSWWYVNPDDYGNDKYYKIEDFYFLKSTYQKINWERFNVTNLHKVATNFNPDPNFTSIVNQESIVATMSFKENE